MSIRQTDFVKAYAQRVKSGKEVAGPHVRDACLRHLRDVKQQKKLHIKWDLDAAIYATDYFAEVLCLAGGKFEGVPFKMLRQERGQGNHLCWLVSVFT